MNFVTKFFLTTGIFLVLPAVIFSAERLSVVTDEWPPYIYIENKEIKGFDYEVMMAVLSNMKYDVDFKVYPWKRCLLMIKNQKADQYKSILRRYGL